MAFKVVSFSLVLRALTVLLMCMSAIVSAVRDMKFYKVLGVDPKASEKDIKKAYKKAALKWHPDRNPDNKEAAESKFREVANAYEVLSDPEKRKAYDMFGEPGLQGGPGGPGSQGHGDASYRFQGGDPFNMFRDFFGGADPFAGMGGGGGQRTFKVHFSSGGSGGSQQFAGFQDIFGAGFSGFPGAGQQGSGGFQQQARQGRAGNLYKGVKNVIELTPSSFPKASGLAVYLIHFWDRSSGAKTVANAVQGVAASVSSSKIFKVGAVDCGKHGSLCDNTGFPLQVLVPNKAGLITYNGRFIASDIKAFVFSKIPDLVVPLRRSAAVDELMHACGASTSKGKGMQSAQGGKHEASWGLCAVLVTDKDESPPLLRSIALQYRGKIAFGRISRKHRQVVDAVVTPAALTLGVSESRLLTVCNGDLSAAAVFNGKLNMEEVNRLLQRFEGGKRCRSSVRLDAEGLSRLRLGQLKDLLADHGLHCKLCLDRSDYVQFVRDHLVSPDL